MSSYFSSSSRYQHSRGGVMIGDRELPLVWTHRSGRKYRHQWSVGDLVIWDNTGTMHRATPYDANSGRMLHRTKLEGEEAFA